MGDSNNPSRDPPCALSVDQVATPPVHREQLLPRPVEPPDRAGGVLDRRIERTARAQRCPAFDELFYEELLIGLLEQIDRREPGERRLVGDQPAPEQCKRTPVHDAPNGIARLGEDDLVARTRLHAIHECFVRVPIALPQQDPEQHRPVDLRDFPQHAQRLVARVSAAHRQGH